MPPSLAVAVTQIGLGHDIYGHDIYGHDISCSMFLKPSTLGAEELVRKKVKDPSDFEWLKQCRFYWREDKQTVIISICDVDFEYSFEYLGAPPPLLVMPQLASPVQ